MVYDEDYKKRGNILDVEKEDEEDEEGKDGADESEEDDKEGVEGEMQDDEMYQ